METARPHPKPYSPLLAECLKTLREREADLHARGILHAGVFGSVARGEERENSDIDVVVEVKSGIGFGTIGLMNLKEELTHVFARDVDIIDRRGLKSPKHDCILEDIILAF